MFVLIMISGLFLWNGILSTPVLVPHSPGQQAVSNKGKLGVVQFFMMLRTFAQ